MRRTGAAVPVPSLRRWRGDQKMHQKVPCIVASVPPLAVSTRLTGHLLSVGNTSSLRHLPRALSSMSGFQNRHVEQRNAKSSMAHPFPRSLICPHSGQERFNISVFGLASRTFFSEHIRGEVVATFYITLSISPDRELVPVIQGQGWQ